MFDVAVHSQRRDLTAISLCTGAGGLDLALDVAVPRLRPVLYVEREAFAVAHLVAAMQAGFLAPAPIWDDARTVPGRRFRGVVDLVFGGIPCQPHSLAGRRLGPADGRDLWPAMRRIVVQSGAWSVYIENVGGMLSGPGGARVWRDLRRLGFEVEGGLFTASEIGRTHERERLFILAVHPGRSAQPGILANADGAGSPERSRRPRHLEQEQPPAERARRFMADADGRGRDRGTQEPIRPPQGRAAIAWTGAGAFPPPGPNDTERWRSTLAQRPHLEPVVRGMADGLARGLDHLGHPARIERTRLLGNGVLPLEAAHAFRTLAHRLSARAGAGAARLLCVNKG